MKLKRSNLANLDEKILRPSSRVLQAKVAKVLHIGPGRFHRAHQAYYFQELMETSQETWGIIDLSLRSPETVNVLREQEGLYILEESSVEGKTHRLMASILGAYWVGDSTQKISEVLNAHPIEWVTLTITEKAYLFDRLHGELLWESAALQNDLKSSGQAPPQSIYGLMEYFQNHVLRPINIISCDNMIQNSEVLKIGFRQYLERKKRKDSEKLNFVPSVVDRIVPSTEIEDLQRVMRDLGVEDHAFVKTEKFHQWVIQDSLAGNRPALEKIGVQFVSDVHLYEKMKLRVLNAIHSALAYVGWLSGYSTVDEAIEDPLIFKFVSECFQLEIAPGLQGQVSETELQSYFEKLIFRFKNPELKHQLAQIAMDGSKKIPERWLPSILSLIQLGKEFQHLKTLCGIWLYWMTAIEYQGKNIPVQDPLKLKSEEELGRIFREIESKRPGFFLECQKIKEKVHECGLKELLLEMRPI